MGNRPIQAFSISTAYFKLYSNALLDYSNPLLFERYPWKFFFCHRHISPLLLNLWPCLLDPEKPTEVATQEIGVSPTNGFHYRWYQTVGVAGRCLRWRVCQDHSLVEIWNQWNHWILRILTIGRALISRFKSQMWWVCMSLVMYSKDHRSFSSIFYAQKSVFIFYFTD